MKKQVLLFVLLFFCGFYVFAGVGQPLLINKQRMKLQICMAGQHSLRITLSPQQFNINLQENPALAARNYPPPVLSIHQTGPIVIKKIGTLTVKVRFNPLCVVVLNANHQPLQQFTINNDGTVNFFLDEKPVLGLGEGGPKPAKGSNWRTLPVVFNRLGIHDSMEPRWQSDAYGSRNPVALLAGTGGWGFFVASPWVSVDLSKPGKGILQPWQPKSTDSIPQNEKNQGLAQGKGLPPVSAIVKGLYDIFIFDAKNPAWMMHDYATITGKAVMPPLWALGYMQSHRTLQDDQQMLAIIKQFRAKKIPLDAVIYLGTGFTPRGWNKPQPSFDFNPEVFKHQPDSVLSAMHQEHVKVVLHMVPWDRDRLPGLQGNIPAKAGEKLDNTHLINYWKQHESLVQQGVDAFWPDEGDWFNLFERIKRHQLYYQGPLSSVPNTRPWSLHRNGYPGIAQWGGWVWSGDTESSWKTLEAQIAVGLNYSLSISPYWGSDIGGFYANAEKTGELYARWFQFGAFCPSFRSHGRTWMTCLPWGWGLSDMGPKENNNSNTNENDSRNIRQSEMNNPLIEPIAKKYAELRYQLMPYTYTLAWQAHTTGMPLMRVMWLHYPQDSIVFSMGNQYLWGKDLLIAPVFEKGATTRKVYLPKGKWYDWWNNEMQTGGKFINKEIDLATMPIYVKAGAIIPLDAVKQYTAAPPTGPLHLKIYEGANGDFTLYSDDGKSLGYLNGAYTLIHFTWDDRQKKLTIAQTHATDNKTEKRKFELEAVNLKIIKSIIFKGEKMVVQF